MMKFAAVFITVAAAFSPLDNMEICKPGFQYCGGTLRNMGSSDKFYMPIKKALKTFEQDPSDELIDKTIFYCDGVLPRKVLFMLTCGNDRECSDSHGGWFRKEAKCVPKQSKEE
ncbi:hypothetical protein L249_6271 [Ophiocordyceps polyrhachis-furcata BCC 54312]|uniref:Uncharacterized protein n=1 Tax=Ophiocordyceps polyrhachis-furcata BCC 54312 TaxID=1330021 RepID=A0A367L0Y0_9HYPO|nr:hypothetical protein L249_6271 [Ophiocordyceps polyrhachis-furcata BCC 54312]